MPGSAREPKLAVVDTDGNKGKQERGKGKKGRDGSKREVVHPQSFQKVGAYVKTVRASLLLVAFSFIDQTDRFS